MGLIYGAVLLGLYLTSLYSYLLFHSIAELFSIIIAGALFVLAWNFRRFFADSFLLYIGSAYLFTGLIDLIHTLAYQGLGIFTSYDANLPTQLWIAARYLQSLALLSAPFLLGRYLRPGWFLGGFGLATALLLASIFAWNIFPVCYVEGAGLTPFKIISEYIIIALLAAAIILLVRKRQALDRRVLRWLILSILFTMAGELAFTFYVSVYALANLVGHYFKIIAFYLIYKAIIETAAMRIFSDMDQLRKTEQALRTAEARERARVIELEALMDAVPAIVWIAHDPECNYVTGNQAAYKLLRLPSDSILMNTPPEGSGPNRYRFCRQGKPLKPEELPLLISASQGVEVHGVDLEVVFDNGETRYLYGNVSPLVDPQEGSRGAVAAFMDITERKQDQAELERYAAQLERSNQDLEQFAFVASHDLQEPLRKVVAFGSRLQDNLAGQLGEEDLDFLARMVNASQRMQALLGGLLSYSRVSTRANPFTRLDLSQVLRGVLSDLEVLVEATQGQVNLGDLPLIDADPLQMHQLFQNLIGNALKFHRPDVPPVIDVTAEAPRSDPATGELLVSILIKDNGIGFDLQDLERIFRPFERLHGHNEYEGTGMGLAICKKIVERHGGTITAQSVPGHGSTFIVTLPVRHKPG